MNQKERMLAGLPYQAWRDGLEEERRDCAEKLYEYNRLSPSQREQTDTLLRAILGRVGKSTTINQPFRCDYGYNILVGENFYANYNLTVLDVGRVTFGDNVKLGPNVSIYTAGHPIHPEARNTGYEYGIPITIGNNVWIGGSSVILPGVTIGDNVVVGAGSVVTKSLPENVIAAGNPCRVIRAITPEDKNYYYRNLPFPEEQPEVAPAEGKEQNDMVIRFAQEKDIPDILDLLDQVGEVHHQIRPDLFRSGARKYDDAALRTLLRDPSRPIFVAEEGGVVGYAFCIHRQTQGDPALLDQRELYIDDLCVDENVRGKGVAKAIYAHVLAYAREQGYDSITLNVWEGNDRARAFYDKQGLKPRKTVMEYRL